MKLHRKRILAGLLTGLLLFSGLPESLASASQISLSFADISSQEEDGGEGSEQTEETSYAASDEDTALQTEDTSSDTAASFSEAETVPVSGEAASSDTVTDALYADYILKNADPAYSGSGSIDLVNVLPVKQTIADKALLKEYGISTIDGIYGSEETISSLIAVLPASVGVYMLDEDADYWVACADTLLEDASYKALEAVFAMNNNGGETVDGCIFDAETGLCYIPRSLYENENGEIELAAVQVQLLQSTSKGVADMGSEISVSESDSIDAEEVNAADGYADIFDLETTTYVETGLDEDSLIVSANGIPLEDDYYEYDSKSGKLTIAYSSASIASISVTKEEASIAQKVLDILSPISAEAASSSDMNVFSGSGDYEITLGDDVAAGDYYTGTMLLAYADAGSGSSTVYAYSVGSTSADDTYDFITEGGTLNYSALVLESSWAEYMTLLVVPSSGTTLTYQGSASGDHSLDLSDYPDYSEGTYLFDDDMVHTFIALACGHVSSPISEDTDAGSGGYLDYAAVAMRIFDIDLAAGTMTVGIVTCETHTQAGFGIVKLKISDPYGYLKLKKTSSDTSVTSGNSAYSLEGAVYYVYDSDGNYAGSLTTGSDGESDQLTLETGDYTVKEHTAPDGYETDTAVYQVTISAGTTTYVNAGTVSDTPITGSVEIYKKSSNTTVTDGNDAYDLSGFVFTLTNTETGDSYKSGKTDEDGYVKVTGLPLGTYLITETSQTNYTYIMSTDTVTVTLSKSDHTGSATFKQTPVTGKIKLVKSSDNENISDGNACYSLEGAVYTVYTNSGCTSLAADANGNKASFTIDEDGGGGTLEMPLGTYYIKETTAAVGYYLNDTVYTVKIDDDDTVEISAEDTPANDLISLLIVKEDAEGDEDADLSGAIYKVCYYDNYSASGDAVRTWYFETDEDGCIDLDEDWFASGYLSDDLYYDVSGAPVLPLGSISVQEISPPADFLLDETIYTAAITLDDDDTILTWDNGTSGTLKAASAADEEYALHYEYPARADLALTKTDSDGNLLSYIPFLITRTWTDKCGNEHTESHIIVTGGDGTFDSSSLGFENVNYFGDISAYVDGASYTGTNEELIEASAYNVWFDDEDALSSYLEEGGTPGALLYGEYTVTELACSANEGMSLITKTFTVTNKEAVSYEDSGESAASVKTLESETQLIRLAFVNLLADIDTEALNPVSGGKTVFADEDTTVSDRVRLDNLSANETYMLYVDFVDEDGISVGSAWTEEFSGSDITEVSNIIDVEVTADTSSFTAGGTITALVYLYQYINSEWYQIAAHAEMDDEDEQLYIPSISTVAMDGGTEDNVGTVSGSSVIIDTVSYENLDENQDYRLVATVVDTDGNVYGTVSKDFYTCADTVLNRLLGRNIADYGEITMPEITLDTSSLYGATLYVNEELYYITADDSGAEAAYLVTDHDSAKLLDEDQAIYYPDVETTASDPATGDHTGTAGSDAQVTDEVECSNLITGKEYTLSGTLHYAEDFTDSDGKTHLAGDEVPAVLTAAYIDGEELEISGSLVTFTAESSDVTITLIYSFDATLFSGASIVVFEDLVHEGVTVAAHADLEDEDQSIYYPRISTTAADQSTATHTGVLSAADTIIDVVKYENLVPDVPYTVTGYLVDAETGDTLPDSDGNPITAAATFTPEEAAGYVELAFTFDSLLMEGKTVVVYETLYYGYECEDKDTAFVLVTGHSDIEDEEQSIHYPDNIKTSALDGSTRTHTGVVGEGVTIVDTVTYQNLVPGETYTITGYLADKETGDALLDADGNEVTGITEFTPQTADGTVDIIFTFDSSELKGKSVVVFETLLQGSIVLKTHEDTEDVEQTINYPAIGTSAADGETGNHTGVVGDGAAIIDTVSYENLTAGETYTVSGYLVSKDTGEAITASNGQKITASVSFTAEGSSGSAEVIFTFDSSDHAGTDIVVFETLLQNNIEITSHKDPEDEDQTIEYPKIRTAAEDSGTGSSTGTLGDTKIIDTVTYENLIPGQEYTISGWLMNKSSGKTLFSSDGKMITAETTFTADESGSGLVSLTYELDASGLAGNSVVVYEELYIDQKLIASHKDIDDECQTVTFPNITKTGDADIPYMVLIITAAAACLMALLACRKKKAAG